jgi:hypothetical protein
MRANRSRTDDIVYYRTDPDLSITDGDILLQGARPLYTEGGAKTGYIVFDFTRENLDDLLGAEVSSGDVLLLLDTHKRTVYCSGQDKSQVQRYTRHPILTFPNAFLTVANTLWHAFCSVPQLRFFNTPFNSL